jgi:hypothetical protein
VNFVVRSGARAVSSVKDAAGGVDSLITMLPHGQAFLAETSIGQELGDNDRVNRLDDLMSVVGQGFPNILDALHQRIGVTKTSGHAALISSSLGRARDRRVLDTG